MFLAAAIGVRNTRNWFFSWIRLEPLQTFICGSRQFNLMPGKLRWRILTIGQPRKVGSAKFDNWSAKSAILQLWKSFLGQNGLELNFRLIGTRFERARAEMRVRDHVHISYEQFFLWKKFSPMKKVFSYEKKNFLWKIFRNKVNFLARLLLEKNIQNIWKNYRYLWKSQGFIQLRFTTDNP